MKRPMSMNNMRGMLLAVLVLLVIACGGDKSVASKSAAAYREAQAKGIAVGGGHEDGGHEAATATGGTAADPHAGHDMTADGTGDHGGHGAMSPTDHAAMDHRATGATHAGHVSGSREAMDHTAHGRTESVDHAAMGHTQPNAHAQHQQPAGAQTDHAQHGGTSAPSIVANAPRSNAEMRNVQPAATLKPDAFDAPAAVAVAEAAKAAQGGGHDHDVNPAAATVYACPMHPEVTSDKPGTCPRCGMTLVKKN